MAKNLFWAQTTKALPSMEVAEIGKLVFFRSPRTR